MERASRKSSVLLVVILAMNFTAVFCADDSGDSSLWCTDSDGEVFPHGQDFVPDFNDACKICTCDKGYPTRCRTAACSPPPGCKQTQPVPRKCCQFTCQDHDWNDAHPPSGNGNNTYGEIPTAGQDNITNLSIRLVASTVTSFLVLALLLFMLHRLRQRRLMRRFEAQARQQRGEDDDLDPYIPAAFLHIQCPPYEDPPPPYSPPKPAHILPQESPPPYQEVEENTAGDLDANANVNNNNNNNQSCGGGGGGGGSGSHHHQSCSQGGGGVDGGGESDRRLPLPPPPPPPGSNMQHIMEAFSAGMGAGESNPAESLSTSATRGRANTGREDETELQLISRRESCPLERNAAVVGVPFHQDYSLFAGSNGGGGGAVGRGVVGGEVTTGQKWSLSSGGGGGEASCQDQRQQQRLADTAGTRGTLTLTSSRGVRRAGRSCSFSVDPDPDPGLACVTLGPMSQSYHAPTAATTDSSVQTHGSYTASLSRHRARAAASSSACANPEAAPKEGADKWGEQRRTTRPLAKCEAGLQLSHRLLQEELRHNLPPACLSSAHRNALAATHSNSPPSPGEAGGSGGVPGNGHHSDNGKPGGGSAADQEAASALLGSPEHNNNNNNSAAAGGGGGGVAALVTLPRSQSVTSTLSVCSETGEVRLKRALAEAEGSGGSVLQSDSQYPDPGSLPRFSPPHLALTRSSPQPQHGLSRSSPPQHGLPRSSPPHLSPASDHPLETPQDHVTCLPDYTFPTQAAIFPPSPASSPHLTAGGRCQNLTPRSTPATTTTKAGAAGARRSVPNPPPSQELRSGVVGGGSGVVSGGGGGRGHSSGGKGKHKKIHLVPLEKSKAFRSKKEKGKSGKKGEVVDPSSSRQHPVPPDTSSPLSRPNGSFLPPDLHHHHHLLDGGEPRLHQPKLGEVMRGRLSVGSPSVKQYGFVDTFAPPRAPPEDGFVEAPSSTVLRTSSAVEVGPDSGVRPSNAQPYHHKPHGPGPHHHNHPAANHRRQGAHGDKPANPALLRPKVKPRPVSSGAGGVVVVVEGVGDDPVAALPQGRRRGKTPHAKKGRQSYPNLDSAGPDRKVTCVDLGLVEPGQDAGPALGGDAGDSSAPHSKRRALDRAGDKLPFASGTSSGVLEGHMSSYV